MTQRTRISAICSQPAMPFRADAHEACILERRGARGLRIRTAFSDRFGLRVRAVQSLVVVREAAGLSVKIEFVFISVTISF